ncbi:MAG: hypothetical protein AAGF98_01235 [Cyanobacteria bacterium P01_H01_bin.153]
MTDQPKTNWQDSFVATNLLPLGYNAWSGFLAGEPGAVVCSLNSPQLGITGENFPVHYIPRSRLAPFLNAWLAIPDTVILTHHHITNHILQSVDGYNPEKDVILLLESGDRASFLYLRNLPISPPSAYEIVCKGWEEFHLDSTPCTDMQLLQVDLTTPHRRTG